MAVFIRTRIQSRKAPQMSKLAEMTAREAAKYGPYGKNDKPCKVDCYGERLEWKSRRAAKFFYTVGARMCEGAESARYRRIVDELENGKEIASDGQPIYENVDIELPQHPIETLRKMKERRDALANELDELRERGCYALAEKTAAEWNSLSLDIIGLTKAMRRRGILPPLQ